MKVSIYIVFKLLFYWSFSLYTGFILDKKIGVNCPKRIENANILIANTRKPIFSSYI
jgi:hypothetical protein